VGGKKRLKPLVLWVPGGLGRKSPAGPCQVAFEGRGVVVHYKGASWALGAPGRKKPKNSEQYWTANPVGEGKIFDKGGRLAAGEGFPKKLGV